VDVRLDKVRGLLLRQQGEEAGWLPLSEQSHGTVSLMSIAGPLLSALRDGGVVAIDGLEASLHPSVALHIVSQFNAPATNPRGAQLLFTTHDTHLIGGTMDAEPLRPDQVWLTEKSNEGATNLYPLSDFKLPEGDVNLERAYLHGRFGAVPILFRFVGEWTESRRSGGG
jgi:AAA15 family ATPase/GTPase